MRPRQPLRPAKPHNSWVVIAIAVAITANCGATPRPPLESEFGLTASVVEVVDGDTIIVSVGSRIETVRLLGIDTPEKPGGPRPAECFGAEASAYAAELLPAGSRVALARDVETRDQYGRLLAYVYRTDDGMFVNHALVAAGYATPLFFAPNTAFEAPITSAANRARRDWIGFWPACGAADVTLAPPQP